MINDIAGLRREEMIEVAARFQAPVVIMHMKGEPKTMQQNVHYDDVVTEVADFLSRQAERAIQAGVPQVVVDPGIGFGKNVDHNLLLLKHLDALARLPCPLLVGVSRKAFLGRITGAEVADRLEATVAAVAASVLGGANIVRVHDVKQCRQAVLVADAIRSA
jgi:dihydropteroate synthase